MNLADIEALRRHRDTAADRLDQLVDIIQGLPRRNRELSDEADRLRRLVDNYDCIIASITTKQRRSR